MKLLNITNRYYIFIAFDLLLIGNAFLAYRLITLVDTGIVDDMLTEKTVIDREIYEQKQIQDIHFKIGDGIEIEHLPKFTTFRVNMRDTMAEHRRYKVLSYEQKVNNEAYRITIWKRLPSSRHLVAGILMTVLLTGLVSMLSFFLLNRWFALQIWRPFYNALSMLKNFDLRKKERIDFNQTNIEEFKTMNKEVGRLMNKVQRDYQNLKEFTENISHETQTPLAIIHSRLDNLLQSENLTEEQHKQIGSTIDAVNRLSKMNKALILLARIENNQYFETRPLKFGEVINSQLHGLEMFIEAKNLKVESQVDTKTEVIANDHLAEILVRNLLSNAVRYNIEGGTIMIGYEYNRFVIKNTGEPPDIPESQMFERFQRGHKPESLGLGLAIVKKICNLSNCNIEYSYSNGIHTFSMLFPDEKIVSPGYQPA
jgi:signal transduction histidine kinase